MKERITISLTIIGALALGYWIGQRQNSTKAGDADQAIVKSDSAEYGTSAEDFDDFLAKFMYDSSFQLDRIRFPLQSFRLTEDLTEIDSIALDRTQWKTTRLFGDEEYRPQIYDNYEGQLRNTNERMFCWLGIENGIYVEYKFKLIDGLWYLIEFRDLST